MYGSWRVLATSKCLLRSGYHILFSSFIGAGMISRSKMEAERLSPNHPPSFLRQSLPAIVPMLLISTGYVDPGKWVATVEGGARFGFDLMAFMLIFNFAAIFCQYISARIGVVTGKNLAQVFCLPFQ